MSLIDSIQKYIEECEECITGKDIGMAEELVNMIVAVYSKDISDIRVGLDRYKARVVGVGTVIKYDYLGDLKLLQAKLVHYKEKLEREQLIIKNGSNLPAININNVNDNNNLANATNLTQITYEQVIESIHTLPDSSLSDSEKEQLEDKIGSIELAIKNKDKKKALDKVGSVLKFITEKGIEVGIAVLPYLGQIAQSLQ